MIFRDTYVDTYFLSRHMLVKTIKTISSFFYEMELTCVLSFKPIKNVQDKESGSFICCNIVSIMQLTL